MIRLDRNFGYFWRNGELKSSDLSQGCVDVVLGNDTVIQATPSCSYIILWYNEKLQRINVERFSEVVIA